MNSRSTESSAPLRITHVTKTLDSSSGGLPAVAMRLAAAAVELGHQVTLVAELPEVALNHERSSIRDFDKVDVQFCKPTSLLGLFWRGSSSDVLANAMAHSDIVHLHGVWDTILIASAHKAQQYGVPYLIAPHGMLDPWSLQQSRLKKAVALRLTHRRLLANAAAMHALNETEASLWGPLKLRPNFAVIPNGIDLRELPAYDDARVAALRKKLEISAKKTILFIGRLHYKKGLDILADAFRHIVTKHDDVDLLVVGPDGGAKAGFESAVHKANLSHRVHVVGPLFGVDKYDAMRMADVFCLPSRQEGFSIAILEALACGMPVVISRGCHFDAVENAGVGRVCDLDAERIGDAISEVLQDTRIADSMSRRGPDWVSANYTWIQANQLLTKLYRQCLSDDSTGPVIKTAPDDSVVLPH